MARIRTIGWTAALLLLCANASAVPIALDGPTTDWMALPFAGADPNDDSGNPENDIVGNGTHSAVYYYMDDLGTPSTTDGTLYFRIRMGRDNGGAGYSGIAVIGLDADMDGAMDLFIRADFNPPGANEIQVREVLGDGLSPGTSSTSPTGTDVGATALNSNWSEVTAATDPTATDYDLDNDGADHFISWTVDFSSVVAELSNLGIGGFNQYTVVNMTAGSSTNASSSMNQDIAGVDGETGSTTGWGALPGGGALTPPIVVPEPRTGLLVALGLVGLAAHQRHRGHVPD